MPRLLRRTSFTARLLALAGVVMAVLIVVDYIALLQLPSRVARDTVEIALRDNVQSLNAEVREDRIQLQQSIRQFTRREDVGVAIFERDTERLSTLVEEDPRLEPDVRFEFIRRGQEMPTDIGVITASALIQRSDRSTRIAFYRPMGAELLNRAADRAGGEVAFALERDGEFVATSSGFPDTITTDDIDAPIDQDTARLERIELDGERRHVYSRALTGAPAYHLHALSTPRMERAALSDIRSDVATAIAGMSVATIAAFLFLVFFTNRTVRRFADRVRLLADGDYGTVMPVSGNDAFAELAVSVNRLSHQLEDQVGQLEQTARAFSRTLETLEEGICVWDEAGNISYWNRGAEQLTGLARDRVDASDPVIAFLRAERAPGTRRVTLPVRRAGMGLVVDLVVTAMPDGGVVQTFRDTTMVDMLQQTQRNFMATAAHELRTPITTILGFADTLTNSELELTDRQREEFLGIIRDQSYELQELAEAFFTNHQLANERVEVSIAPTPIDGVVADALGRVEKSLPERAGDVKDIVVDVPDKLAALADRRALVGVFSVLLENAIKYGAAPITVSGERSGGTVALLVSDEGPGIDLYHQAHVFDPFFRIDVDMRSGVGGAGLGLFTARKLVEAMHGTIRVRSTPGDGTSFIVELPAGPVRAGSSDEDEDEDGRSLRLVG